MDQAKTIVKLSSNLNRYIRHREQAEEAQVQVQLALTGLERGEAKLLAEKLRVSEGFLSDLRHGRRDLPLKIAVRMLEAL